MNCHRAPKGESDLRGANFGAASPLKRSLIGSPGGPQVTGTALDYLSDEMIYNILRHLSAEDLSRISKGTLIVTTSSTSLTSLQLRSVFIICRSITDSGNLYTGAISAITNT